MISNTLHPVPVSHRIKKEAQENTNRSQFASSQVSNQASSSFNIPGSGTSLGNSSSSLRNRITTSLSSSTTPRHRSPSPLRHIERNASHVQASVRVSRNPLNNQIATNRSFQGFQQLNSAKNLLDPRAMIVLSFAFLFYAITCQEAMLCKERYPDQPPYSTIMAEKNCYAFAPHYALQGSMALVIFVAVQVFNYLRLIIK